MFSLNTVLLTPLFKSIKVSSYNNLNMDSKLLKSELNGYMSLDKLYDVCVFDVIADNTQSSLKGKDNKNLPIGYFKIILP